MVVVCACVAGGCQGPLFVLGPFVLAGDGLRGGALFGCFSRGFFICGKDHGFVPFSFGLVGSGEGTFYFWITARPRTVFGVWWLFVLFLSGFWAFHCFCDSSDLKGF